MINKITGCAVLNSGVEMPWLGLGVYLTREGAEVYNSVTWALEAGYRHIDTAAVYNNEGGVGRAVKDSGIARGEIFITTKVWNSDHGFSRTRDACRRSLDLLDMEYVDMYMIHWPGQDPTLRCETWEAMIRLKEDGLTLAIGVSNFCETDIKSLEPTGVVPDINQVELHPYLSQKPLKEFCEQRGIRMEAWGPLMHRHLGEAVEIDPIAQKYGKTRAQTILRWHLQNGVIAIPKSVRKDRIVENAQVFDFELCPGDMAAIDALNRNQRFGSHPRDFNMGF